MTGMQFIADGREQLKRPVMFSAGAHVGLAAGILALTLMHGVPIIWGEAGGGGAATVNLVSSASVPLPPPTVPTKNTVATENKGLNYTEPQPKPTVKAPPDDKAVALPAKNAKVAPPSKKIEEKPKEAPQPTKQIASTGTNASEIRPTRRYKQAEEPVVSNEVPYGEGGAATGPYGTFQADGGSGGVQVTGDAGDFNSRFSWYVTAIRGNISRNWMKSTVDPSIRTAPRVYVAFQIYRDGRVVNPQVTASSGVPSLDNSALRAVYDSSPMPPLPPAFPGSSVAVEFWFDFKR